MDSEQNNEIKAKVLIADDEYANRLLLKHILEEAGIPSVCVADGYEVIEALKREEFALALIDIQMPGLDGFAILKELRINKVAPCPPVIFVSAVYPLNDYQEYAIECGAVDFLSKPINPKILVGKIKGITELYIQKKELEQYRNHLEDIVNKQYSELVAAKERAEDADKLKTAFLNNLSHEIRTPLNAIVCCSDLIAMPDTDPSTYGELSEQIKKSTRYLLNLVDNIINISKLESGNTTIKAKPTDLVFLFKFIFEYNQAILARDETKRRNIRLIFDNQIHEHSLKVTSDENFLRQIVSLLIENAVKFTERGTVSLSVNIEKPEAQQELLNIEVTDTGIGISQDDQKIIFEKFRKAANMGDKIYDGAGIGLAIIKKQIGMLNGTISLQSKLGVGSKFTVTIPITRC